MKLSDIRRAYFVGIKGTGMSSAAQILAARGVLVSGSDTNEIFFTEEGLRKANIFYFEEFSSEHIDGKEDIVVYSTAYNPEVNLELLAAKEKGIFLMSYPEFLGMLVREKLSVAVCGSHGKTTTTAMLACVLDACGFHPDAIVGSQVLDWKCGGLYGQGMHFVFEADEYQNKFEYYSPWSVILTNIDWDHPDYFTTPDAYRETFRKFLEKVPPHGFLLVCGDDAEAIRAAKDSGKRFLTYGFSLDADFVCRESDAKNSEDGGEQHFSMEYQKKHIGDFSLRLAGKHNIRNAAGVAGFCFLLKADMKKVALGLRNFHGTSRRFEYLGERSGVKFFDDYAHHPTEIQALLEAVRGLYSHGRVFVAFQPHTFSRTETFLEQFAQCFLLADRVYILDIYASAREKSGSVTSQDLVQRINTYDRGKALFSGSIENTAKMIEEDMRIGDIVFTVGAGDVWRVGKKLMEDSLERTKRK